MKNAAKKMRRLNNTQVVQQLNYQGRRRSTQWKTKAKKEKKRSSRSLFGSFTRGTTIRAWKKQRKRTSEDISQREKNALENS
jgi:hypothetical protein